jgi:cytochrome c biogenesis protein
MFWEILNSRKFGVYVLGLVVVLLIISTFLPNYYTLSNIKWYELERDKPVFFWIASRFSTPFLVKSPFFLIISIFLFLSTVVCTISRVNRWVKLRESEFSKDRAFSFSRDETSRHDIKKVGNDIETMLSKGRWERSREREGDSLIISGQKGRSGFWGSVVFHIGLIICFFAGPVSYLTTFRGELVIPEDMSVPLREGFASHVGRDPSVLPNVSVTVHDFRAEYFERKFKYDFGGVLTISEQNDVQNLPFSVNNPIDYRGYQFSLHEYGFSPRVRINKEGKVVFDYYLNLRHPDEGDRFEIAGEGLSALVMFFPDFIREGTRIGSKSKIPDNPVTMIKLFRGDTEVFKGLFKEQEKRIFEEYEITVDDFRYWTNLVVVRESGITVFIAGFLIGMTGLVARFLSNERRLEFVLSPEGEHTRVTVKGYSRYYPAFLEREVISMARNIKGGEDVVL